MAQSFWTNLFKPASYGGGGGGSWGGTTYKPTALPVYQGPVMPGTNESIYRQTGRTTPSLPTPPTPPAPRPLAPLGGTGGGGLPKPPAPPAPSTNPSGTNPYATNPDYLARFEQWDVNDPQRIAAYEAWLGTQGTQLTEEQQYINDMYGPAYSDLESQANTLEANKQLGIQNTNQMFDPYFQQLSSARESAIGLNQQNVDLTRQGQQSAIDQATQVFNELQQRQRQLYGGVNSAGQFGSELQGRELQRNVGQATDTATKNIQSLQTQLSDINSNYETSKSSLEQQKRSALIQLEQDFNTNLQMIESQKTQLGMTKADAKYQALRDYNANKQQLLETAQNYATQLQNNALAAKQQVASAIDQYQAQLGQQPNLNEFPTMNFSAAAPQIQSDTGSYLQTLPSWLKKQYGLG